MAITAEFTADFTQFIAAAKDGEAAINSVVQTSAQIGADTPRHAQAAGLAIRDFATKTKEFATDYIKAFADEEAATNRLAAAITASGQSAGEVLPKYQAMATQFQVMTRFSDDAVIAAQQAFTQIARLGPEQMQPAVQAAADLAASLGIGLEEAARKIATVIGTDGAKLGTLKAMLGDVNIKGKSAAEILEIFNQKFGGAAAADMATSAGQLEHFNNTLDDFKGQVGGVLASALTPLLDAFSALSPTMQTVIAGGTALMGVLVPIGIALGSMLSGVTALVVSMGGWAAVWTTVTTAIGAAAWPVTALIAAVTALYLAWKNWDAIKDIVKGVYDAVKLYLLDHFTKLADLILLPIRKVYEGFAWLKDQVVGHSVVPDMIDGIAGQFDRLQEVMVDPTIAAANAANAAFGSVQLPGSSVGGPRGARFLESPTGQRVPISDTGSLPDNWFDVYSGKSNFADVISDLGRPGTGMGMTNNIYVNGTAEEVARKVADELMRTVKSGQQLGAWGT
jgi:hypothetical protein